MDKRQLRDGHRRARTKGKHACQAIVSLRVLTKVAQMLISFSDDGEPHTESVAPAITQDRLENILQAYAAPTPQVRYRVVPWNTTDIGLVEVVREPELLPYLSTSDIGKLEVGAIFVRHGSHTERATVAEEASLHEEGRAARG